VIADEIGGVWVQLDDIAVTRVLSGTWRLHALRLDRLWRLTNAVIVGLDDLFGLRDLSMSGCTGAWWSWGLPAGASCPGFHPL